MFDVVIRERSQDRLVLHAHASGQIFWAVAFFLCALLIIGLFGVLPNAPGARIAFVGFLATGVLIVLSEIGFVQLTLDRRSGKGHLILANWRGKKQAAFDLSALRGFRYDHSPGHEQDWFSACPFWDAEGLPKFDLRVNDEAEGRALVHTLNQWLAGREA